MNGYFYVLVVTAVCGGICSVLVEGGFEKYIKYIAALVCTLVMITPLKDLDMDFESQEFWDLEEVFSDSGTELYPLAAEMTEIRGEEYISQMVFSQFGIKALSVDIKIDWGQTEPVIQDIEVVLPKEEAEKKQDIGDYLKKLLGGEVRIIEG